MGKHRSSVRRAYATRRKYSPCRGLMTAKCRNRSGCKMALGKKRSFCRRSRSARHRSKARRSKARRSKGRSSKARRSKARTRRSRAQSGGMFGRSKKAVAVAGAEAAAEAAPDTTEEPVQLTEKEMQAAMVNMVQKMGPDASEPEIQKQLAEPVWQQSRHLGWSEARIKAEARRAMDVAKKVRRQR